jgi:integrase
MGNVRPRPDTGRLYFDFMFQGVRYREQTLLPDTPANRKKLKAIMERIEAEIVLGAFDYAKTFPGSKNLPKVAQKLAEAASAPLRVLAPRQQEIPTLAAFVEVWWMENEVRWREATRIYHRGFLDKHLLPAFGAQRLDAITRADVLQYRSRLAKEKGRQEGSTLSPKTV